MVDKQYDVFGLCNPFIDIITLVNDKNIEEFGLEKGSIKFVTSDEIKVVEKMLVGKDALFQPGGAVANTVSLITRMGGKTFYSGKVGDDDFGKLFKREMEKLGVSVFLPKSELMTARAITLITPDCERTFIDYLGAAIQFRKSEINIPALKKSKIFYVTGFFLEELNLREAAEYAMAIAKQNNSLVAIDVADAALIKRCKKEILRILSDYADIIFANEKEAEALTGETNPKKALKLMSNYADISVIKLGAKCSIINYKGNIIEIPGFKVKAIDTTGAGDAYAGAFLYGLSNRMDIERTGRLASYVGAKAVETFGARFDDNNDVKAFIKEVL
jgi:sugar/nucleoside kinase (ribokinase family)